MSDNPHKPAPSGAQTVRAYHARTKHRFEAYAEGPGQLDWDAQPAAFRHFIGAPRQSLPLAAERFERPFATLFEAPTPPVAITRESIGAWLEVSLGISAWKQWGPSRWAVRCNPSSGNLHPVEAYLLCRGIPEVADGLHHYDPLEHGLETRAKVSEGGGQPVLAVALSSVMWREAWKYGERAFRYCQLDVGHAVAALAWAAAWLGWRLQLRAVDAQSLLPALGLDRETDFPPGRLAFTEAEEPECLLEIELTPTGDDTALRELLAALPGATWLGTPSPIDRAPGYRWPAVDQAARASREGLPLANLAPVQPSWPPLPLVATTLGAAALFRQRRSAQRFNPRLSLDQASFFRLLDGVLPRPQAPWSSLGDDGELHLLLFVLRVEGLPSGLYALPRSAAGEATLLPALSQRFGQAPQRVTTAPAHLPLWQVAPLDLPDVQRLSRSLACHQDIASTSSFALAMLGAFDAATQGSGAGYRHLLRQAGVLGHCLYLEAEAAGVRGTGIGCYFDDPVHELAGLDGTGLQSLYHFTVGFPVDDARIDTSPPYPHRLEDTP